MCVCGGITFKMDCIGLYDEGLQFRLFLFRAVKGVFLRIPAQRKEVSAKQWYRGSFKDV